MKEFMIAASFEKMESLEDEWLAQKARETLKRIELREEKTIPWKLARNKKTTQ